jgi:hypothetical protein
MTTTSQFLINLYGSICQHSCVWFCSTFSFLHRLDPFNTTSHNILTNPCGNLCQQFLRGAFTCLILLHIFFYTYHIFLTNPYGIIDVSDSASHFIFYIAWIHLIQHLTNFWLIFVEICASSFFGVHSRVWFCGTFSFFTSFGDI